MSQKLEIKNRKIYTYINQNELMMKEIMKDYSNYIETIIQNASLSLLQEDQEEVLLDVFMTLWKNRLKLDVNKNMSAYIGGITKNLIKYKFRQNKLMFNIEDFEEKLIDLSNIEFVISKNEREQLILNELNKLKEEDKEVFIEYYYGEKNIKEIAKRFDMSEAKVKSKLFRVRKRLSKVLREEEEF